MERKGQSCVQICCLQLEQTVPITHPLVWFSDARRDVLHAARLLRRHPVVTMTATLSLAIGIGANTTIFTVANALLFQPPAGVVEPSRLVDIGRSRGGAGFGPSSYPDYLDIRRRATTLDGIYAYSRFPEAMSVGGAGLVRTASSATW